MSSPAATAIEEIDFLRSQPLAGVVQAEIERWILSGELKAGVRLNELEIARSLGISRAPVRESLRTLEQTGLVVSRKNYGVFVRIVSLEEASEIYQIRAYIDEGVGRELARRIDTGQLAELRRMVERMESAFKKNDAAAYHETNVEFHERMVEIVGNRKLRDIYRKLLNELILYRRRSLGRPGAMPRSVDEHRGILAAIRSGNVEAAGKAMRDHIVASGARLQRAHATTAPASSGKARAGKIR
ncbi:MAG TPA: FCD domain-containing protein [Burkholderiales bacterium]|nr:FCD domain-containing protein [Burkholderiales bacterium]